MSGPVSFPGHVVGASAVSSTTGRTLFYASDHQSDLESIRISLERLATNHQIFLNVEEAAKFLRLSPSTIHRLKDAGSIPYTTGGLDRVVFYRHDLVAYMLSTRKTKAAKPAKPTFQRAKKASLRRLARSR